MPKYLIDSKLHSRDKMYGATTMGSRGQVVIPAKARKDLKLKPGDQLMVMGKFGKVLGLIKAEQISELVNFIMDHVDRPEWKREIKKHMDKVLNQIKK